MRLDVPDLRGKRHHVHIMQHELKHANPLQFSVHLGLPRRLIRRQQLQLPGVPLDLRYVLRGWR